MRHRLNLGALGTLAFAGLLAGCTGTGIPGGLGLTQPTSSPASFPTTSPTSAPTNSPTNSPTSRPTAVPTVAPTSAPTNSPTPHAPPTPTAAPTSVPTRTAPPTQSPTPKATATPTAVPTKAPTPTPTPDMGINLNWNTNVFSSEVTGTLQPLISVMPAGDSTITLAFATGTCGSETWATLPAATIIAANMPAFVASSKYYIVSTGGADGAFECPTTSAFLSFVKSYYTSHMLGVDFDIEAGQSQAVITQLATDVKAAEAVYPSLRFSFTVGTLGQIAANGTALGTYGVDVMNAIKSVGLTKYTVNLMAMDYGSASAYNCIVVSGACEMGQSAVQAAEDLHSQFSVPYSQIEITPMIGGNDSQGETFTIADVATVSSFVKQNGLAGVHFWSFDRDKDCAPGSSSSTCNTYGTAGTLGFTKAFVSDLGL
jgi:chitinase